MMQESVKLMRVRTLLNPFKSPQSFTKVSWNEIFPHCAETLDVEIGFGTGSFIQNYAQKELLRNIIGFEIRRKMVDIAQEKIKEATIANAHLVWGNGHAGLRDMFDDQSVDRVIVLHPDPWPRRRHNKRRVLSSEFVTLVHKKLKMGHCLYLATDVEELWHDMFKTIQDSGLFTLIQDNFFWEERYQSRWKEMSERENRKLFCGTFQALDKK